MFTLSALEHYMDSFASVYSLTTKYTHPKIVNSQCESLTKEVPSLRVSVDNFVWNDGREEKLLKIHGTIPTSHVGVSSNTPIRICLPRNFPELPPECYVEPTSYLKLKPGHKHVWRDGQIFLPYLHEWKKESSDLVELVTEMTKVFKKSPPVISTEYIYPELAKAQHERLTKSIPSLHVTVDDFVWNSGRSDRLIKIYGTIPVKYYGVSRNSHICIWLPMQFPTAPPECYVDPTPEMRIKPHHDYVDTNGKIYLPYLQKWTKSSDLNQLVAEITEAFEENPPLIDTEKPLPDSDYQNYAPHVLRGSDTQTHPPEFVGQPGAPVQQPNNLQKEVRNEPVSGRQLSHQNLEAVIAALEEELQSAIDQKRFSECSKLDKRIKTLKAELFRRYADTESETKRLLQKLEILDRDISDREAQLKQKTEERKFIECIPLHEHIVEFRDARQKLTKRIKAVGQETEPPGSIDTSDGSHEPLTPEALPGEYSEFKFYGDVTEQSPASRGLAAEHKETYPNRNISTFAEPDEHVRARLIRIPEEYSKLKSSENVTGERLTFPRLTPGRKALHVFDELNCSEARQVRAPFGVKYVEMPELKSVSQIGEGKYGFTFGAEWNGQKVGIKAPKKKPSKDEEAELSILMRLPVSPNVVSMIGLCARFQHSLLAGEHPSIIIPFMKNGDLKTYLESYSGDPTELDYINIVLGISRGISHLHAYNVVHRDIALRNFLVGDDFRIILADFGLSRSLAGSENIRKDIPNPADPDGVYVISPNALLPWRWCPPETFQRISSKMSDIWMLGVTILEIFEPVPFPAEYVMDHMKTISQPDFVLDVPDACPEALRSLAHSCCTNDAAKRPTITAIIDKLLETKEKQIIAVPVHETV